MSHNLFDNYTHPTIQVKDKDLLLGLSLRIRKTRNIPQIIKCLKSTPAIRIPRWKTELTHDCIITIDNKSVKTIDQVHYKIQNARNNDLETVGI